MNVLIVGQPDLNEDVVEFGECERFVHCLRLRVTVLGIRVQGSGFRGIGLRGYSLGCIFRVWSLEFGD